MVPFSVLSAAAVPFLEDIYSRYQADPSSVDPSWTVVFRLVDELTGGDSQLSAETLQLASSLRLAGHGMADINPLAASQVPLVDIRARAFAYARQTPPSARALHARYCGTLGVETAHIDDEGIAVWVRSLVETLPGPDVKTLLQAHRKLVQAEEFEAFLGKRFPGKKRFGAEGAEAIVTLLDRILSNAAADGVRHVVIGTMHRGRLNILANVLGKPVDELLAEFKGAFPFSPEIKSSADVSYHLGYETVFAETGLSVTLLANPSHLEAVDPVVLGRVRAMQDQLPATERASVLGIILHTDAAVVGQGVVSEILQLGMLEGFATGGTVHLVINNQLGFTTEPDEGRTSRYCTGAWKAIDSLILHANGDDADAVIRAADLATGFRKAHGRDCVVDLVCYRRNGHNEMDEPRFTQPRLYQMLEGRTGLREHLEKKLVDTSVLTKTEANSLVTAYRASLEGAYAAMPAWRAPTGKGSDGLDGSNAGSIPGVERRALQRLLDHIATVPEHVTLDTKLQRLVQQRGLADKGMPWAVGEALAFASLLMEGIPVRLSGQDIVRGAFSHRNFALTDITNGERHISLQHLAARQAPFSVVNSPLSEFAVLGFEYGYSLGAPQALTIWEAQFGDFVNGAQIMVDQFVVSGEEKWCQRSSLVILLPHGLEGQGPEHSSARIERFLQLAALDNIRIAIPTTPANYFHLLRRQAHDPRRKPLIVFAPKTLLRLPAAVSMLEDFTATEGFQPVIVSPAAGAGAVPVNKILLCGGKLAYALMRERERCEADGVLIVRLEQMYPLPEAELGAVLKVHPGATLMWAQEEPVNMGAWSWLDRRLEKLAQQSGCRNPSWQYCGRPEAASPAGSFHEDHADHQEQIVAAAFG